MIQRNIFHFFTQNFANFLLKDTAFWKCRCIMFYFAETLSINLQHYLNKVFIDPSASIFLKESFSFLKNYVIDICLIETGDLRKKYMSRLSI